MKQANSHLSATAPDTIVAAVAAKTYWKKNLKKGSEQRGTLLGVGSQSRKEELILSDKETESLV